MNFHEQRRAAIAEVESVYKALADRPVLRDCIRRTECCQFKLTGRTPHMTKGEALLAVRALRAAGRTKLPERTDGACPMLHPQTGKCIIYQHRPFGCRTHFCDAAGGPYSRKEVLDLIRRLEIVDAELEGQGPHPLPMAMEHALREN